MKKCIFILLLAAGCSSKSGGDTVTDGKDSTTAIQSSEKAISKDEVNGPELDLMRELLKKKFNIPYNEKIERKSLTFSSSKLEDDRTSSATYRKRGKLLIITIDTNDGMEMTTNQNTSIYNMENNEWKPMADMIDGVPDTLIDLNADGKEELIMYNRQAGSAGADTHHDLYVLTSGDKYTKAETFTFFQEGYSWMNYVDGAKQRNGKVTYMPSAAGVIIHLDVHAVWAQGQEELERGEEDAGYALAWNGTKLQETLDDKCFLTVHGKDTWVRDLPTTGKVVMKLNEGDKCRILEKGKQETIRDMTDFWYKIDFNGSQGWIFGSQTSYKQ